MLTTRAPSSAGTNPSVAGGIHEVRHGGGRDRRSHKGASAFREYLTTLGSLVSAAQSLGKSGETLADAVMPTLREKYEPWNGFADVARGNVLETAAELSGRKRIPQ